LYGGKFTSHIDEQLSPRDVSLIRTPYTPTHTPATRGGQRHTSTNRQTGHSPAPGVNAANHRLTNSILRFGRCTTSGLVPDSTRTSRARAAHSIAPIFTAGGWVLGEHHMDIPWVQRSRTGRVQGGQEGDRVRPGGGQALLALGSRPKQLFAQSRGAFTSNQSANFFSASLWSCCGASQRSHWGPLQAEI
jgi:hypothetical protein